MSANRKNSGRQSNLFSYFQKTPKRDEPSKVVADEVTDERENMPDENERASKSSPQRNANITPLARRGKEQVENKLESTPTATPIILESDDENSRGIGFLSCASSSSAPPTKRRRVIFSSDSEEETNGKKFNENETPIRSKKMGNEGKRFNRKENKNEEKEDVEMELGENEKQSKLMVKVKATKIFGKSKSGKGFKIGESTASFIDSFSFDSKTADNIEGKQKDEKKSKKLSKKELAKIDESSGERFPHLDFWHLKPENIKDANGKRPSDANYDPKTLYVPGDFLKQQTPAHQQWWKLKTKFFDTVLFFKVGKFYELFHMDAVIGVENLGLAYMRGKFAHAGFPEIAYGRFADQLVNRGYKVARIEQTEKPEQLAERQKTQMSSQREKVVKREICRVTTLGTKTYGILDGMDSREMVGTMEPNPSYLMALTEKKEEMGCPTRFGVCFVDCSVGRFLVSEFVDDHSQSNLRTLLAHNYPAQLIYEKGAISAATNSILTTMLGNVKKEAVLAKKQFQTAEKALEMLCRDNYLGTNYEEWPEILRKMLVDCSATIPHPEPTKKLSLSALGAVLWYLEECLIDVETVSTRKFEEYIPPSIQSGESAILRKYMVLDGVSLLNLHILPALSLSNFGQQKRSGPVDKSISSFSLLNTINRCQTAFGKRLLRQWVSAPNCDRETLLGRQNALKWMLGEGMRGNVMKWAEVMRKVPDLERMFQRVHTIGLKYRADPKGGHPDSRAQMFDAEKYNKRKIRDLLIILDGIEQIEKLVKLFNQINDEAEKKAPKLLEKCLGIKIGKMSKDLEYFKKAFDRESALKRGVIIPHGGVDKEYDDASREVEERKTKLEEFLGQMKKMLKCSTIKYIGSGRNQYQMEIPEASCRNLPAEFEKTSQRKGFKRYSSPELQKLIKKLGEAENRQLEISSEVTRRVFADFDERKNKWAQIVQQIAVFDCLLSLALYAQQSSQKMCFPEFVFDSDEPFLELDRGYYPSLVDLKTKKGAVLDFIPNSCHLGGTTQSPPTMLLTGPNMGGKSTYMRQIASLCVLAQIGSMVPAESMRLSPIDRIFCRIGASDRLAMGQSTFYVELAETNRIIQQATPHSLVIIDELGRGTSTHDGTAIAAAVLKHISNKIRCRTIFSTHYHSLCKFISSREDGIQFAHMACIVENANVEDPTMESVTFLYTLTEGICNKSYGFYTAKMAGLDVEVVRKAFAASKMLMEKSGMGKGV